MKVAVLSFAHERAETYVRLLRDLPGVDLVTADPDAPPGDPARGRALADRLGVTYLDDWDEVFASMPDAVVVTSEADRHVELIERSGEAEAHVLCEYPLATSAKDVKAIMDSCDMGGVRLRFASPAYFSEAFAAVRRGIAEGVVGTLTTVHGSYTTRPGAGGGALRANLPYLLDLVDAVLGGDPAEQVYAQTNEALSAEPGVESAAVVAVRYRGGVVASFDCSHSLAADGGPAVTFVGDRASVEYDACPRLLGGFDAATGDERREPGGVDLYSVMVKDFVAAFETEQGNGPDGAAGLRAARIVEAAYESARTGQPVHLGR
ncbi:Gfo/Idh/MocA family protein [Micromonospora okii]|uniref:RifT n=1 Tax=Micromonospora okii TaxID=1182970 RepID=A0A3Q9B3F7_9ACTN|nr:Gfo/Idh/MocA family oxidoreductase [Micromonospora okii]AZO92737.1 RifT [Micromonospora okii]